MAEQVRTFAWATWVLVLVVVVLTLVAGLLFVAE
jgi:hypothetical protein